MNREAIDHLRQEVNLIRSKEDQREPFQAHIRDYHEELEWAVFNLNELHSEWP